MAGARCRSGSACVRPPWLLESQVAVFEQDFQHRHLLRWQDSSQRPNTTSTPDRIDSSLARLILPTASPRTVLSRARIWETFATESFGRPVACADKSTLPGASAHFKLLVSGTQTGRYPAAVEGIALHNDHRPPKTRLRADGVPEIGPSDFTLSDHRSWLPLVGLEQSARGAPNEGIGLADASVAH